MSLTQDNQEHVKPIRFISPNHSKLTSKLLNPEKDFNFETPAKFYHLIPDFNNRRFTPTNINEMIELGDYLLLEHLDRFITENCIIENEEFYTINKVHKSKILKMDGLNSSFWDTLKDDDIVIPSKFIPLISDFNIRKIIPSNMNDMIRFCDYLCLENTPEFIIKNSRPSPFNYYLDEDNQGKFYLPCFLNQEKLLSRNETYNTVISYKSDDTTKPDYFKLVEDIGDFKKLFYISYDISRFNLTRWLRYIILNRGIDFICLRGMLKGGSLECLKISHQEGIPLHLPQSRTKRHPIQGTAPKIVPDKNLVLLNVVNSECLEYVYQHGCIHESLSTSGYYGRECSHYAKCGNLNCLKFAHANNFPWTEQTTLEASKKSLECLQYTVKHGCPYNLRRCSFESLRVNQLDCFKYLLELGLELIPEFTYKYINCGVQFEGHSLDILKFLYELGCPFNSETIESTIEHQKMECFEFAISIGCPLSSTQLCMAASKNNLQMLKILIEHGAPWTTEVCSEAAAEGHLDILKYAFEHNLEWDSKTTSCASCYNQLECLKFAVNHGCPINIYASNAAASKGNLECLTFLVDNNCPTNQTTVEHACMGGFRANKCFQYLVSKGLTKKL